MLFIDPCRVGPFRTRGAAPNLPTPDDMAESIDAVRKAEYLDSLTLVAHGAGALT